MRVKKQKQLRRHVNFYKTCFGFREPFKVLCDGTFVHYSLSQRLGGLQDSLSAILGAPAKPLVTRCVGGGLRFSGLKSSGFRVLLSYGAGRIGLNRRCVTTELKKLGEAYSGSALAARRLDLIK